MRSEKLTRAWFAVTTLVALTGLVTQVVATATDPGGRVANLLSFFTIDSNLLVAAISAAVALGVTRKKLFAVLWLDALVGIIVTGIVYQVALAGLYDLHGLSLFSDTMLHKVTPILFVLGWLVAGPRGALTWRTVWWSLLYPLAWLAFTLPRGAVTGFYPYPFVDAGALGYGRVTLNCVAIGLFFTALAIGALLLDRPLSKKSLAISATKP
ncbi:Pr6Pr family membrane protein [Amycolatopsis sp. NBC_01488]|uniref:Pr6Pr family membrane protein n=1 Tax=Amycolatopsis sp. NBC_01488 TaxID=2903563 RepID=UPI002E2C4151|nr:Pr6Pr family membrane protein [Amycolatopsis sp. NBC_01488]